MKYAKKLLIAGLFVQAICGSAFAATEASTTESVAAYAARQESIQADTALIQTKKDLRAFFALKTGSNPLNLLSQEAKSRLLDRSLYDAAGRITTIYTGDIEQELSPGNSYKVLALFGAQSLAAWLNNGKVATKLDMSVLDYVQAGEIRPYLRNSYCNGGYCTDGDRLVCVVKNCTPPHLNQ
ncbi:hypothetical protein AACH06_08665 [Ideonella sp. DXS29W]|uniref:Uncharacterized protein n=1 Tax=Ideonella lacteola TaxID=2984193 RepID=A0ABU9BLP6_9BURK